MPIELGQGTIGFPESPLTAFLLLLARMSALGAMAGLPGFRNAAIAPRIVLITGLALAAWPGWASARSPRLTLGSLAGEILLGLVAGVAVNWLQEGFTMGFQIIGTQAGFSYASTIDPSSQADSTVMPLAAQLAAGLLLFAAGLDRDFIRAVAASPAAYPAGSFSLDARHLAAVSGWTADSLTVALRLALPIFALLLMTDIALALLSRVQAQLQLLSLAFPLKMSAAVLAVAWLMPAMAGLYGRQSGKARELIFLMIGAAPPG